MKLTVLLLTAAFLQAGATGLAQNVTLSAKNMPLEKVFTEVEKQTGHFFIYPSRTLDGTKPVDIDANNMPLANFLEAIFRNQPLKYRIESKTIIVSKRASANASPDRQPDVPPVDISGRVVDEQGNPLVGASVNVKGSSQGTTTIANGEFRLAGVDEHAALVISYVGYITNVVSVSANPGLKSGGGTAVFVLKVASLNEVIINKGYYTEKQRNTVGNVATITAKDIEKQPVQNPLLALQGRVPGLEITQLTGMNGGGVQVRIQGRNSINSGLDPLIVVDGVPFPTVLTGTNLEFDIVKFGSPLNYINPGDIEAIDILKDADATALYGSRAANGAILITTKKGKAGNAKVSLNMQQGWGTVSRSVDMMNTQQYLEMRREGLRNSNRIASSNPSAAAPFIYAPDLTIWDTTRYTDWQKELLGGTAQYTDINASISGGTQMVQYSVGATYNRTTTVFPGDFDDKKGSAHFNISSMTANQRLKIQMSGSYMYDQNQLPRIDLTQTAVLKEPNAPSLYNDDGTLNWAPNTAGSSTVQNPLVYTKHSDFKNTTKSLVSNLTLNYRVIRGLEVGGSIGYTSLQSQLNTRLRLEYYAPENRPSSQRSASFGFRNMSSWIAEPQARYNADLGKGKIQALIGSTIQKTSSDYLSFSGRGFPSDQLMKTLTAATTITMLSSINNTTRYNALFGRFNYSLNNKYILNVTARRDGSNNFGDNNKFSNFWSAGGAWIFSDEPWLQKSLPFLHFGKLRVSYGTTGNDQITSFSYVSTYALTNPAILYQGGVGFGGSGIPNPNLQWEVTRKWQVGFDLGFFNNRVNLGITYARNRSSNQLVNYVIPAMTGSSSMVMNFPATVQNISWEAVLNTANIRGKDFSWTSSVNLTIPKNKLVRFPGIENSSYADPTNAWGIVVGQPLGVKAVNRYIGIDPKNGFPAFLGKDGYASYSTSLSPNQYHYIDLNVSCYGGLSNSFRYKGIELDILFQFVRKIGSRDFYWYNSNLSPGRFSSGLSNQPVTVLDRWQKPGDIASSPMYSATLGLSSSYYPVSDAYYNYDASFVRLKNISLSWQLPGRWVQKMKMQTVRVYAHAQNLLTITNYSGIDPESGGTGLPPLRMITTGVNVEF